MVGIGEQLSRQRQVYRAARVAHRNDQCAIDQRIDILVSAKFVLPLGVFPNDSVLVERILTPVDGEGPRSDMAILR